MVCAPSTTNLIAEGRVRPTEFEKVTLVHLSWSEVMHEIRMLLSHHPFTDPLPMWILAELLKYLEHPRSGTMAFHDMGVTWVPVREAVAAGTLRSGDRKTEPLVLAWHRLVRQLGLGLTARLGVPVKQSLPRRRWIRMSGWRSRNGSEPVPR